MTVYTESDGGCESITVFKNLRAFVTFLMTTNKKISGSNPGIRIVVYDLSMSSNRLMSLFKCAGM